MSKRKNEKREAKRLERDKDLYDGIFGRPKGAKGHAAIKRDKKNLIEKWKHK